MKLKIIHLHTLIDGMYFYVENIFLYESSYYTKIP